VALKPIKGQPGRFLDTASGQVLNIAEYREDDKYDSIFLPSGHDIDFGSQFVFFRDVAAKRPVDCNFTQPSRLSAGEEMVIDRVGLYPRHAISGHYVDQTGMDFLRVIDSSFFRVDVNQLLLTEGPSFKFPSGYGIGGYSPSTPNFNVGVPSTAAAAKLVKTQTLTSRHEVIGYLIFHNRDWILNEPNCPIEAVDPISLSTEPGMIITAFLHGLLKTAASK
jgi:hypothetical protein